MKTKLDNSLITPDSIEAMKILLRLIDNPEMPQNAEILAKYNELIKEAEQESGNNRDSRRLSSTLPRQSKQSKVRDLAYVADNLNIGHEYLLGNKKEMEK